MQITKSNTLVLALLPMVLAFGGCATLSDDAFIREQTVQHSEQRLAQREHELVRARRDLSHFRKTLRHLRDHESAWSRSPFEPQLVRFLEERVAPLVSNEWQTSHPELARLDVDLRLLRVEALLDLRMKRDARRAVRQLASSYRGQDQMLVTNSLGERATLKDSLRILNHKLANH